ncbi:MAG: glycosyl hydrolase family 28-related protein [bacterium]
MKKVTHIKRLVTSPLTLILGCVLFLTLPTQAATFNVKDYGAVGDGKADNTAAFSRCIQAVIKAGGGKIFLPDGLYRGRIIIPAISKPLPSWMTIEIVGESEPTPVFGTIGNFPLRKHGTIIQCLEKSGPAVISVSKSTDALYGEYSAVHLIIRNLDIRSYDNPAIDGVDLQWAMQCRLENVFINTDIYNVQATKPTHGKRGLITPESNNAALTILRNVQVTGYHTGILVSEHTDADNIVVASNTNGLEFVFAHHASHFRRVGAYRNTNHVAISGKHGFQIEQLNTENSGPGQTDEKNDWQKTIFDVTDPENLGTAEITYWVVVGNIGAVNEFKLNGGRNIRARRIGTAP